MGFFVIDPTTFIFKSILSQNSDVFNGEIKSVFLKIYTFDLSLNSPLYITTY